jgi:hypothetical protein
MSHAEGSCRKGTVRIGLWCKDRTEPKSEQQWKMRSEEASRVRIEQEGAHTGRFREHSTG